MEMAFWKPTTDVKYGVVIYNYDGDVTYGLRLTIGDSVQVFEECSGWYRGCVLRNKALKGIFPASYICPKECTVENAGTLFEAISPKEDPFVKELTSVLREWTFMWKQKYVKNEKHLFVALGTIMWDLVEYRQRILSGTLSQDQINDLKEKAVMKIDWGNCKMDLDLVPRIDGEVVNADSTSVVELYEVHMESAEASSSLTVIFNGIPNFGTIEPESDSIVCVIIGRGSLRRQPKQKKSTVTHHLYFNMTNFMCNVEESCEVFFSIYEAREGKFISERFLVNIKKSDENCQKENQLQKISNSTAVFTDLGSKELAGECYLVAQIIRLGKMLTDQSAKKVSSLFFRRPYGCAILDVTDVLRGQVEEPDREHFMPIFTCSDTDYPTVHESILKKQSSKYNATNFGIYATMRMLHGELVELQQENPLLLPKGIPVTRKLGFPEVIMPGDVRNDLYVTIDRGEFEKGSGKTTAKNVEVSMCVIAGSGRIIEYFEDRFESIYVEEPLSNYNELLDRVKKGIPVLQGLNDEQIDSILLGSGGKECSEYESIIFYHNNSPKYSENIKVQIPIEKFIGAHLRFGFRHLSKAEAKEKAEKTFGFSFIKLMREDGTTIRDGPHDLCVYKYDEQCFYDSKTYAKCPSSSAEYIIQKNACSDRLVRSMKESFYIRTTVCSTKLTQNVDLVGLLRWRSQRHNLQTVLTSLLKIDGEEIVKFLQDIFDALFCILNESIEEYGNLVFKAMVFIICILSNNKYQHFQAVLNTYIEKHFSGATAFKKLVSCVRQTLDPQGDGERIENTKKIMTALEYIFKFIIQSKMLHRRSSSETRDEEFKETLYHLFRLINALMITHAQELLPTKKLALQNFTSIYPDALKIFSPSELSVVVKNFINSLAKDPSTSSLTESKLHCFSATIKSPLFAEEDPRRVVMPALVSHLHYHLSLKQEMRKCGEVLGELITALETKAKEILSNVLLEQGATDEGAYLIVQSLLQTVFKTVLTVDRSTPLAGHYLAVLIGMLRMMKEEHYSRYLKEFKSKKTLREFLLNVFVVFTEMIRRDFYPKDWTIIKMLANNVILTAIQELSQALTQNFLVENDFDHHLWNSYFHLAVTFLTQPGLQLEKFTEVKRNKIIDRYGDMRQVMGFEISSMWQSLGPKKKYYIPSLIGPFLKMTLVPETELRRSTIPIFFDMMESELRTNGYIKQVENEMVKKLDTIFSSHKGDEEYEQFKDLFHEILAERCRNELLEFREEGLTFVNRIRDLLELLNDYRSVIASDESIDRQMSCIVSLLEFHRKMNREDMYIKYLNRLCKLHIPAENFTEAGFTMLLHAELLDWSESFVDEKKGTVTQRQLKEKIYIDCIEYFDKGKMWEKGIELCKELAELYESKMYDFVRLSDILKTQAKFYKNIMKRIRPEPEYFRVGFYGKGFPSSLRNKTYVYRGLDYEKIGAFNQRIQVQFPDVQIMDKNSPPDEDILQSEGQFLQCCRVVPVPGPIAKFKGKVVNERIRNYYKVNNVKRFTYSRPFHRGPKDKSNEFASLWLERTTLTISSPLPGILRWFPVISTETEEVSPLENAVETVESKNEELQANITRLQHDNSLSINPLSMILNGVIDAAVMGGIAKYQEAFFTSSYLDDNPDDEELLNRLKRAILDQLVILQEGLELHERLSTANLKPFHNKMVRYFHEMRYRLTGEEPPKELEELAEPVAPSPSDEQDVVSIAPSTKNNKQDKERKLSLPSALSRTLSSSPLLGRKNGTQSAIERDPRHSLWYESSDEPPRRHTLLSSSSGSIFGSSSGFGSSVFGSSLSLGTLDEVPENDHTPPVPDKMRPPSDPLLNQRIKDLSQSGLPEYNNNNNKSSSPTLARTVDDSGCDSPVLPPKKRVSSGLLTSELPELAALPPPLPPRQSAVLSPDFSVFNETSLPHRKSAALPSEYPTGFNVASSGTNSNSSTDGITPPLPPKTPLSGGNVKSQTADSAGDECPIPLPKKRQSYTVPSSSHRTSDLFSPATFPEFPGPLFDEFQRNQNGAFHLGSLLKEQDKYSYDKVSLCSFDSFRSSGDFDTVSIADSEATLTPLTPKAPEFPFPSSPSFSSVTGPGSPYYDPVPPPVPTENHLGTDTSVNPLAKDRKGSKDGEFLNFDFSEEAIQNNSLENQTSQNEDNFVADKDVYETLSVTKSISSQLQVKSSDSVAKIVEKETSFTSSETKTLAKTGKVTPPKPLPRSYTLDQVKARRLAVSRTTSDSTDVRTPPVAKPRRSLLFGSSSSTTTPIASSPDPSVVPSKVFSPPAVPRKMSSPPALSEKLFSPPAVHDIAKFPPPIHPRPSRNTATPPPMPKPYSSKSEVENSSTTCSSPSSKRKSKFLGGAITMPLFVSDEPDT